MDLPTKQQYLSDLAPLVKKLYEPEPDESDTESFTDEIFDELAAMAGIALDGSEAEAGLNDAGDAHFPIIILEGSTLYNQLISEVQWNREANELQECDGTRALPYLVSEIPSCLEQLLEHQARYTFSWKGSFLAYSLDYMTTTQDVADESPLDATAHPFNMFARQLRAFFNLLGHGRLTTSVILRAWREHQVLDDEFQVRFTGEGSAGITSEDGTAENEAAPIVGDAERPILADVVIHGTSLHRLLQECVETPRDLTTFVRTEHYPENMPTLLDSETPALIDQLLTYDAFYCFEDCYYTPGYNFDGIYTDAHVGVSAAASQQALELFAQKLWVFFNASGNEAFTTRICALAKQTGEDVGDDFTGHRISGWQDGFVSTNDIERME
ncbi:hypothetical protein CKM354_000013500 [Cercospora kikuchii]|uniref:Uncharacterized protein n=1 Tax=Cercospora kikuchii TaxID=84275 RepID=A0A9P3C8G6_9PEZI|nr:uncharacterized protein CKM354_000013500 [Cercospora kikuchii]GIZ36666.1 hypothetical protein CKM354_000013500 [Cercospora kikuchii]